MALLLVAKFFELKSPAPVKVVGLDLLPDLPSLIRRICSSFAPPWGVLRTRLV
jgi:hypothetical protein